MKDVVKKNGEVAHVMGMFLKARNIQIDSQSNPIQAMKHYTVEWDESKGMYIVLPEEL